MGTAYRDLGTAYRVATLLAARAEEARPMAQMRDAKKRMVDELGLEFVESCHACGSVEVLAG